MQTSNSAACFNLILRKIIRHVFTFDIDDA